MPPVSIALCITDLNLGGAERQLAELATRVDRSRFQPVVYCLGARPSRDEASCVPLLEQAGVQWHCLNARGMRHFPRVTARLTALLRSQHPAILQSFLFHANFVGRLAARRADVPHVVCGLRVAERQRRWHLWMDRLTQAKVDRYVCVSQSVANFSRREARLPGAKLVVIPNGIDLDRYTAVPPADLTQFGIPPAARVAVCIGRLVRQKGQAWLLRSALRWLPEISNCHLLIVGAGPDRARLEKLAQQPILGRHVHFAGWNANVPGILAASTVLVLPSAWEGMPNILLEGMASRLPVVASNVEGVAELLGPLADQQTVPYGDDSALASRIESILGDESAARFLGRQNRQRVESDYSLDRVCRAYEHLWSALQTG